MHTRVRSHCTRLWPSEPPPHPARPSGEGGRRPASQWKQEQQQIFEASSPSPHRTGVGDFWGRGLYSGDEPPVGGRRSGHGEWRGGVHSLYGVIPSRPARSPQWLRCGGWWWWLGGLDVSGKVQRVAFEFSIGDGGVLQVVEQHLNLREEKTRRWGDRTTKLLHPFKIKRLLLEVF